MLAVRTAVRKEHGEFQSHLQFHSAHRRVKDLESWEAWSVLHMEPILTNTAAETKMSPSVIPVSL